jgi:ferredoxin
MSRSFVYLRGVTTLRLDAEKCTGCGTCLEVCPHAVLAKQNGKVRIQDRDACMECGACSRNCPVEAITVKAGVGCAAAVINAALGRTGSSCCCVVEEASSGGCAPEVSGNRKSTCC